MSDLRCAERSAGTFVAGILEGLDVSAHNGRFSFQSMAALPVISVAKTL